MVGGVDAAGLEVVAAAPRKRIGAQTEPSISATGVPHREAECHQKGLEIAATTPTQ